MGYICPKCQQAFHVIRQLNFPLNLDLHQPRTSSPGTKQRIITDYYEEKHLARFDCPCCSQVILVLSDKAIDVNTKSGTMIWPVRCSSKTAPLEVNAKHPHIAKDYNDAVLALDVGLTNASAATSRRCLQNLLRENEPISRGDLNTEINTVIQSSKLGSRLESKLHEVRVIGNLASHPSKDNVGVIVEVEPSVAMHLLNTLEDLMDHYYVKPENDRRLKQSINNLQTAIGKPTV